MAHVSDSDSDFEVTDIKSVSRRIDRMKSRIKSLEASVLLQSINDSVMALFPILRGCLVSTIIADGLQGLLFFKLKRDAIHELETLPSNERESVFLGIRKKLYELRFVCSLFQVLVLVLIRLFIGDHAFNSTTQVQLNREIQCSLTIYCPFTRSSQQCLGKTGSATINHSSIELYFSLCGNTRYFW
jgi:hypothetical protein